MWTPFWGVDRRIRFRSLEQTFTISSILDFGSNIFTHPHHGWIYSLHTVDLHEQHPQSTVICVLPGDFGLLCDTPVKINMEPKVMEVSFRWFSFSIGWFLGSTRCSFSGVFCTIWGSLHQSYFDRILTLESNIWTWKIHKHPPFAGLCPITLR